ncbi:MAG: MFS transporter [Prevotella sp.]|nr:MFS transporter [Prevotella sp.]
MPIKTIKATNFRWVVCTMLCVATMINYMDRQVLSLTWKDFIAPQFAWKDSDYGMITAFFSITYAVCMFFAGKFIDWQGVKKGYMWAVAIWSLGAIMHAFCGVWACGVITGEWLVGFDGARETLHDAGMAVLPITTLTVYLFMGCRFVMALGQAGNFPAAIKATVSYFPKKDRAFATAIFNNGASVGALLAPLAIPTLASHFGWEMAFVVVGALGYVWMLVWLVVYDKPSRNGRVNNSEFEYIYQDEDEAQVSRREIDEGRKLTIRRCLTYRQTWAFFFGKFMTDGVWWFFLFWTPVYLSDQYGYSSDSTMGMALIFVLYLITMLSIVGGYLPTYFVERYGNEPYRARMKAMFYFACVQLIGFLAQPLGGMSPWLLVLVIGVLGASHQSWSANIFSMVGDLFPRRAVATVTGLGGCAGGVGSYFILMASGILLSYAEKQGEMFAFLSYSGKQAAYMMIFCLCSVSYLIGWFVMKLLVPKGLKVEA